MLRSLRNLSRFPRNYWVSGTTFIVSLSIGLLLVGSMNNLFATRQLHYDAQAILLGFQMALTKARDELESLPPESALACQDGISKILARRTFANGTLRWLAVARDGQIVCRSHVVGIDWSEAPRFSQLYRMDDRWSIRATSDLPEQLGIFLVLSRDGAHYIAALEPPRLDYVSAFVCPDCRSFKLRILGYPPLEVSSEPMPDVAVLSEELRVNHEGLPLALTLEAGQAFLDHYRLHGWLASIGLVVLVAALLGYGVLRLLQTRDSLDFLIREGLRRRAFVPYYQPIIDARDGQVLGAEALLRWRNADGSVVPPDQFIPYAENSGLILPMTDQLTEIVTADAQRFGWAGSTRYVSINLVPEQLHDDGYGELLARLMAERGLSPCNISIEITERRQFRDLVNARRVLGKLVDRGIEIKLDDAGTGFGGFAYVQELPMGTLKIDKLFVDTLRVGADAKRQVLDAIVEFAHTSGLQTIAEGVETPEQVAQLVAMGVFAIQGYVYARPMKSDDFIRWMAAR